VLQDLPLALLATSVVLVLAGLPALALSIFAISAALLERQWWAAHPEMERSLSARMGYSTRFYAAVHQHEANRLLHVVGIPFLWAGFPGLLAAPTYGAAWWLCWLSVLTGVLLNAAGHLLYEPDSDAWRRGEIDVLSIVTGSAWDLRQIFARDASRRAA